MDNKLPPWKIPNDVDPIYANVARISHTLSEMVIDYARFLPGDADLQVLSRVVLSPTAAKLLCKALADNLSRYEAMFGEIRIPGNRTLADDLFHAPPPPAPPSTD